ncbi:MAG: HD domain-containing protein [Candidatus Nitrosocaldaceae archaeon]
MRDCIVKGCIIPKTINNTSTHIIEFNNDQCKQLYKEYVEFFKKYIKTYFNIRNDSSRKLKNADDIRHFLDSYVLYLKSLIYIDALPLTLGYKGNIPSPTSLLRRYMSYSSFIDKNKDAIEKIDSIVSSLKSEYEKESDDDLLGSGYRLIENGLLDFPADTRPAYNTSSLIHHMLITSSIASSLYMQQYKEAYNKDDLQTLRLISLFHDIGKIEDWHKHQTISAELLKNELLEYTEGDAYELVIKASKLINGNYKLSISEQQLYELFKRADKFASASDRLQSILLDLLSKDSRDYVENKSREYGNDAFNKWEFWESFNYEDIKRLTEEFCKNISKMDISNPLIKSLESEDKREIEPRSNEIIVVRFDFSSIQNYIKSSNIRVMNGASRLVDEVIYCKIPLYIIHQFGLPAESVVYIGGGNLTAVFPEYLKDKIDKLCKDFKEKEITLSYGYSFLYEIFLYTNREIDKSLGEKKLSVDNSLEINDNIDIFNLWQVCESCGIKYIENNSENLPTERFCKECKKKFKEGNEYHFKYRIKNILSEDDKIDKLLNRIMEYIAGHSINEIIGNKLGESKDIALIKIDGNIMGQFMASSVSLTDAFERSVRIDYSVKKAFHSFLEQLNNDTLKGFRDRIIMGLMYIGGDDSMILMPSVISIPFALHMLTEYNILMGKRSTLSISIFSGKPKHPVQLLKECSEFLLNITKNKIRKYAQEVHSGKDNGFIGGLSFHITDVSIDDKSLEVILKNIEEKHLGTSYYILTYNQDNNSIFRLLNVLFNKFEGSSVDDYIKELLKILVNPESGLLVEKEFNEKIRSLRNELIKNMRVNVNGLSDNRLRILYTSRNNNNSIMLRNLLIYNEDEIRFHLFDLYKLLKMVGIS